MSTTLPCPVRVRPARRTRRLRAALLVVIAAAAVLGVVLGAAPAAFADPAYSSGGCQINRSVDGPVAGGSQCAGADLAGAKLAQSDFDGADLSGADLSKADVQASTFAGANIAGANFTAARIVGADLTGSGILPATVDAIATSTDGTTVDFQPALPTGLTMTGCTIVGEPVVAGAVFPLGQTAVVCSFASSRANEVATAVVQVTVSTPQTSAPPVPVFTEVPSTAAPAASTAQGPSSATLVTLLIVGGGVVVLGAVALVVRGTRGRPRDDRREY